MTLYSETFGKSFIKTDEELSLEKKVEQRNPQITFEDLIEGKHALGKGAEAIVHSARMFGEEVVIKERIVKKYRIKEIDEGLRTKRTSVEGSMLKKAQEGGVNVPQIHFASKFELFMQKIDGKNLHELPEKEWEKCLGEAGAILAKLHSLGIAHGDYTPANLIVTKKGLFVIDFGLSMHTNSIEDKAVDLLLMKKSLRKAKDFELFLKSYLKHDKEGKQVAARVEEIEKRGRYAER